LAQAQVAARPEAVTSCGGAEAFIGSLKVKGKVIRTGAAVSLTASPTWAPMLVQVGAVRSCTCTVAAAESGDSLP
jgi:hypothetical protein